LMGEVSSGLESQWSPSFARRQNHCHRGKHVENHRHQELWDGPQNQQNRVATCLDPEL